MNKRTRSLDADALIVQQMHRRHRELVAELHMLDKLLSAAGTAPSPCPLCAHRFRERMARRA